ncbi:MAG: 16S rRNA (guanine(527)-N(7))-methyltransferase RsmG [Flammeovirgaceae bacterium]
MDIILKYFPDLTDQQIHQFSQLQDLYADWNTKINVISRKDIENLYERHVLHSLSIGHFFGFDEGEKVLDIGTGGGFPGIPLAILFPEAQFHLVDSIAKKIKVVQGVAETLQLTNVTSAHQRAEKVKDKYDFVVSRAVTNINALFNWIKDKIKSSPNSAVQNGLICLKGGDLKEEFSTFKRNFRIYELQDVFEEEFFETKKLVYVPK